MRHDATGLIGQAQPVQNDTNMLPQTLPPHVDLGQAHLR